MEMQDFYYRHIGFVFDNYEDTYWTIQGYVKLCTIDPTLRLSDMLAELYATAIDKALSEIPETWLGHRLIGELCHGVPRHIFDELADRYLPESE